MNTGKPSKHIHTESVQKIWKWLSSAIPSILSQDYTDKHVRYIKQLSGFRDNPHFGPKIINPDEAQTIPDNSAHFENVSYTYKGLTRIKSMIDIDVNYFEKILKGELTIFDLIEDNLVKDLKEYFNAIDFISGFSGSS